MARLLHHHKERHRDECDCDHWDEREHHHCHDDHDHHDDHDDDCDCPHCGRHHKRRRKLIPVGRITVDCTPVTFKTPGQARNIVSCPVKQVVFKPVVSTVHVTVPKISFVDVPVTQVSKVPVLAEVNKPPIVTPFSKFFFPFGKFLK